MQHCTGGFGFALGKFWMKYIHTLHQQQVNGFYYGYHKDEMEMKCLTNRGHSILNVVN